MTGFARQLALLAAGVFQTLSTSVGHAREAASFYDIPEQDLPSSLLEFSRQSGVMIIIAPGGARACRAPALRGSFSRDEAIRVLLRRSRLRALRSERGGYIIESRGTPCRSSGPLATRTIKRTPPEHPRPSRADVGPQSATIQEIIVTAQKREQSLQDVPISVTAVTQETIQANHITDVRDLNAIVPNLAVRNVAGSAAIPSFSMRGLQTTGGLEKPVSLYIDGVFIGSSTGSAFELPDLERIEVLRGPQGTLFGRNSTGGAISIVTR
ncbi:MAG TPA: TonB-dependent receptor plug domain-containing protein, partial [Novosphingobium sp.]|nr:TonB-dependent receptor plug domain-containing protein [Novosphingobium sp.]